MKQKQTDLEKNRMLNHINIGIIITLIWIVFMSLIFFGFYVTAYFEVGEVYFDLKLLVILYVTGCCVAIPMIILNKLHKLVMDKLWIK